MCGICGIATTRGPVDADRLRDMARTLYHRGPDSEGMHVDGTIGIAARRLAIIDVTGGDQPIANEDGSVVVVQNGEIYNYRELMHELERAGHRFRARPRVRAVGAEALGAAARHVRRGRLGRPRAPPRARPRPVRDQAGLLPRRRG
jgi:glucosamine 6-phosphate synthetase-like amidotransferase/phosphosugar isomerase protein